MKPDTRAINRSYTFDSFIVGTSNKMAYNLALEVTKTNIRHFNPLFIYSDVGLGKTHLLNAIGNKFIDNGKKVIYTSNEKFMNDFVFHVKNQTMHSFRNKYRTCDILLMDDAQFFANKPQTQEEFFHTFNELYLENKQIVIVSDRLPSKIDGLVSSLKTRFEGGLIVDIREPLHQDKIEIINKKCVLYELTLSEEIVEFIASFKTSSIREVEGIIIKLVAYSNISDENIDLNFVIKLLDNYND